MNRFNVFVVFVVSIFFFSFGAVLSTVADQDGVTKVEECGCLKDGKCVCGEGCDCAKSQEDGSCDCSECQVDCNCPEGQNCSCGKRAAGECPNKKKSL